MAWVSTGATGAWHLPKFWTSPLAPADLEVLNTNWHPQSSFYAASGTQFQISNSSPDRSKDFEAMKAGKSAILAQIQTKSQFLFNKNLPLRDFSIMTLPEYATNAHNIICKVKICLLFLQALNILQDPAID